MNLYFYSADVEFERKFYIPDENIFLQRLSKVHEDKISQILRNNHQNTIIFCILI